MTFFEALDKIPPGWAAVLGALITAPLTLFGTLTGVWRSNKAQKDRLKQQLDHDAAQKAAERKFAMRRDIYLKAAEELANANNYLGTLLQADLSNTNIASGLQGLATAGAKISAVGEMDTVQETSSLVAMYGELILQLAQLLDPIQSARDEIEWLQGQQTQVLKYREQLLAAGQPLLEPGQMDQEKLEALRTEYDVATKRLAELSAQLVALHESLPGLNDKFTRFLLGRIKELASESTRTLVAIRRELDIESDLARFKQILASNLDRVNKQVDEILGGQ